MITDYASISQLGSGDSPIPFVKATLMRGSLEEFFLRIEQAATDDTPVTEVARMNDVAETSICHCLDCQARRGR